jgi:predicted RNase H-like HicB family nuclease
MELTELEEAIRLALDNVHKATQNLKDLIEVYLERIRK